MYSESPVLNGDGGMIPISDYSPVSVDCIPGDCVCYATIPGSDILSDVNSHRSSV